MKLYIALLASITGSTAFLSTRPTTPHVITATTTTTTTTTSLNSGPLGFDINSVYTLDDDVKFKLQKEIMDYLQTKAPPTPVALRPNLGTTVLISGFDPRDVPSTTAATMVLDFLNDEDSPHFPFKKIVAHVGDVGLAKKRMIGRNARYTGLLDKLSFTTGETSGEGGVVALPTKEQLDGVSSWVAYIDSGDMSKLSGIVEAAEAAPSVKNVAILVSGAQKVGDSALKEAEEMLKTKATSFAYTLVIVGELNEEPEAQCAYGIVNVTDAIEGGMMTPLIDERESFSREESLRIVTECLAMEKAAGKCIVATSARNTTSLEGRLIQGMRELGYTRPQEIEHMVTKGAKGYNDLIAAQEAEQKSKYEIDPELEAKMQAISKEEEAEKAAAIERNAKAREDMIKQGQVEEMAREWAKREYRRKTMQGKRPMMPEEQFFEIVKDRALFESDMKWRTMKGLAVNEGEERKRFKEDQKKKREEAFKELKKRFGDYSFEDYQEMEEYEKQVLGKKK